MRSGDTSRTLPDVKNFSEDILLAMEKEMIGITLEVRISNAPAQHLYHKHGYRAEGLRKNYYPDTHEDAVIMWKYTPFYEGQED